LEGTRTHPPGFLGDSVDAGPHKPGHISPTPQPNRKNERAFIKNVDEQTRARDRVNERDRVSAVSGD